MTATRLQIYRTLLYLAPIAVAWLGMAVAGAVAMVALLLLWRWALVFAAISGAKKQPEMVLDSIAASHFVEKVRWSMDQLGINYTEQPSGGTLGVFFTGRTVPRLRIQTGAVETSIGNSPEILRFLWGVYGNHKNANILEPTPERLALEQKLDRYARNLQVWIYWHLRGHRALTLQAWGANCQTTPRLHRVALKVLYPLQMLLISKAFRLNQANYMKAIQRIEELLSDIETRLADGRTSILRNDVRSFTDFAFAAYTALWLQPPTYGGGKADGCQLTGYTLPSGMTQDIARWQQDYPQCMRFVKELYASERNAV